MAPVRCSLPLDPQLGSKGELSNPFRTKNGLGRSLKSPLGKEDRLCATKMPTQPSCVLTSLQLQNMLGGCQHSSTGEIQRSKTSPAWPLVEHQILPGKKGRYVLPHISLLLDFVLELIGETQ